MDTHIPEGMQPMLHPHKRKFATLADDRGPMKVVLDRTLGRARNVPNQIPDIRGGLLGAFRRFMRDGP